MAKIEIEPGERFEHMHPMVSTTTLVSGSAELLMDGATIPLAVGVPVTIPARAAHVLINVGPVRAVLRCGYASGETVEQ